MGFCVKVDNKVALLQTKQSNLVVVNYII
jgi:hypothetical protein